jgi:hypothetical protein
MKLSARKPFARLATRTAIALAVVGTCASVYALSATADAATPGKTAHPAAVARPAASGWHLRVNVQPGVTSVAVCTLGPNLSGHNCTIWSGYSSSKWQLLPATNQTYSGTVTLIWNPAWYETSSTGNLAYATRGHWNYCTLPSGSGTLHVTTGVPNCD